MLILPHPLTDFEIKKYYENDASFNGVYSRNYLAKIKDVVYIIHLDEYKTIGTHWAAMHVNYTSLTYFRNLGFRHIPKEINKIIGNKNIMTRIYRIQAYDSRMCWYFCIGFIYFILKNEGILKYTNLISCGH